MRPRWRSAVGSERNSPNRWVQNAPRVVHVFCPDRRQPPAASSRAARLVMPARSLPAPGSDPTAERHRGLTYFLVPLDADGVTVRGFGRLDGDEGFAEVFLDDVFVPDDAVLGGVDQGWSVAMATAGVERGLTLRSPGRFLAAADRLVGLYRAVGDDADPGLRDDVVRAVIDAEAYRWQTFLTVSRMLDGESTGSESSMTKIFWSEMDVRIHETALGLLGADAELDGPWMKGYQFALSGPIYAGTNEIQRNVIAERVLGLPRK